MVMKERGDVSASPIASMYVRMKDSGLKPQHRTCLGKPIEEEEN